MTVRKARRLSGRRPSVDECLEAWWRIVDVPVGRILPDSPHGKPGDSIRHCDTFDLYCWRLAGEAFSACKVRGIPPIGLYRLVVHILCGGKFKDFRIDHVVEADPQDPGGFHSRRRPITNIDRLGVDDAWIARSAYAKFRKVLQTIISSSDPYLPPPQVEKA